MKIPVRSRLHMSFHEAGHIEAAYLSGATVELAGFDIQGSALTRVVDESCRIDMRPIACGGLSAEMLLYEKGWLSDAAGEPLSHRAFEAQALRNTLVDKLPFYLLQPPDSDGMQTEPLFHPNPDGQWPMESDKPFIAYAIAHVVELLRPRFESMLALAMAISAGRFVRQEEIEAIRARFP